MYKALRAHYWKIQTIQRKDDNNLILNIPVLGTIIILKK